MSRFKNVIPLILFATFTLSAFQNCGQVKNQFTSLGQVESSSFVCDPLSGTPASSRHGGLRGHLYHLTNDQPRYDSVFDFLAFGNRVDADLFFTQLYVPTRSFDSGFRLENGDLIKNEAGENLFEYFAIDFHSRLQLANDDLAGAYQFALLSDDGGVLSVNDQGRDVVLVNNDGNHSTRMACSSVPLTMGAGMPVPMRLQYHQGPRYHLSLVLLWREWPAGSDGHDPLCGASGNDIFFDSQSRPLMSYNQLLNRGWRVVGPENFLLPEGDPGNPCAL